MYKLYTVDIASGDQKVWLTFRLNCHRRLSFIEIKEMAEASFSISINGLVRFGFTAFWQGRAVYTMKSQLHYFSQYFCIREENVSCTVTDGGKPQHVKLSEQRLKTPFL